MTRILIAEDESRIVSFLEKGLRAAGLSTYAVDSGPQALALARSDDFDLLLLDIGLPGMNGYEVLRELRARGETIPIVMLTGRSATDDTVAGLEGGADDYVPKPFRFDELLARIRARLRDGDRSELSVLRAGRLALDLRNRMALIDDRPIDLTAREFALLETMIRHQGQVLSRQQLLSHVWGYDFDPGSNIVDVYVRYLRNKLGPDSIETVRRMGYRLRPM